MEVSPIGIQSGYSCTAPEAQRSGGEARPLTLLTGTISNDSFNPSESANPTYGRSGRLNNSSHAEDARKLDQANKTRGKDGKDLSEEETAEVRELKQADRTVRAHEMAHMAAGAGMVKGGASYSYKRGPDGNLYAVAGEVSIDTSEGRTPQETITRMQRVKAAALAPSDPSPQDRAVAAAAAAKAAEAAAELATQKKEQAKGTEEQSNAADTASGNQGLAAYQRCQRPEKTVGQFFQTIF